MSCGSSFAGGTFAGLALREQLCVGSFAGVLLRGYVCGSYFVGGILHAICAWVVLGG